MDIKNKKYEDKKNYANFLLHKKVYRNVVFFIIFMK